MHIHALISCILYFYGYKYDYKCMLLWLKMIKMIIFMFKSIFLIFHFLIKSNEHLMTLIHKKDNII